MISRPAQHREVYTVSFTLETLTALKFVSIDEEVHCQCAFCTSLVNRFW